MIPKEHIGNTQNDPLIPEQISNQTTSPIPKKKYSKVDINRNQHSTKSSFWFTDEDPISLIPENLFDNLVSEDNTAGQSNITKDQENQSEIATEKSNIDQYANIRIIPIEDHDQIELDNAIKEHPLTPIVEIWINQRGGSKDTHNGYRHKMKKFLTFLIDLNVKYPTAFHLFLYKNALKNSHIKYANNYISITRTFFKWAKTAGFYNDISIETYDRIPKFLYRDLHDTIKK